MDFETLGNLGDFLGGIAVIATLVYLALQIRQNTSQIAENSGWLRAQTYRADQTAHQLVNLNVMQDESLARIYRVALENPDALTPDEWMRSTP